MIDRVAWGGLTNSFWLVVLCPHFYSMDKRVCPLCVESSNLRIFDKRNIHHIIPFKLAFVDGDQIMTSSLLLLLLALLPHEFNQQYYLFDYVGWNRKYVVFVCLNFTHWLLLPRRLLTKIDTFLGLTPEIQTEDSTYGTINGFFIAYFGS